MSSTSTCVMFPSLGHHPVMAALRVNRALETMVLKWYMILTTHRNRQLSCEWFKLSKIWVGGLAVEEKRKEFRQAALTWKIFRLRLRGLSLIERVFKPRCFTPNLLLHTYKHHFKLQNNWSEITSKRPNTPLHNTHNTFNLLVKKATVVPQLL